MDASTSPYLHVQAKLESVGWAVFDGKPAEVRGPLPFVDMVMFATRTA